MNVRHAQPQDAGVTHDIASSLRIDDQVSHSRGFLIYVLDEERYRKRIELSPFFYVVEVDNWMRGFLMCLDNRTLHQLAYEGEMAHEGNILRFVLQRPPPYVFIDQIGIQKGYSRRGFGKLMVGALLEEMRASSIPTAYVSIVHGPIRNSVSIQFFERLHFEEISKIDNGDGYFSGMYRIELF